MQYVKKVTRVYLQNLVQVVKVPPPSPRGQVEGGQALAPSLEDKKLT